MVTTYLHSKHFKWHQTHISNYPQTMLAWICLKSDHIVWLFHHCYSAVQMLISDTVVFLINTENFLFEKHFRNPLKISVTTEKYETKAFFYPIWQWGVGLYGCDGARSGYTPCSLGAAVRPPLISQVGRQWGKGKQYQVLVKHIHTFLWMFI